MADDQKPPHILAFPFPIPGHMNPLMHVCRRLASDCGFRITYVCNQTNYKLMLQTRDLVAGPNGAGQLEIVALDDGVSDSNGNSKPNPSANLEIPGLAVRGMGPPMEELLQGFKNEGNPVACILTDTFNGWVQDVADKFSIPRATFWTSNAINDIIHLFLPKLISEGFVPVASRKKTDELVKFLPGIPPIPATDLPLSFYFEHPVITVIADGAKRFPEAEFGLCNTFEELEPHAVSVIRKEIKGNYFPVGPCLSPAFFQESKSLSRSPELLSAEDLACLSWLDSQEKSSVIYVSFGSVATMSVEQIQELALGLEQSDCHFLLVVRETLVSDSSVKDFFLEFAERTRDRALVISWAPQMHVLLHPAVGGFLTHCGWNSTIEGICAGVPMLAWPCMAEQNVNCKELVRNWRIAIEVKSEDPSQDPSEENDYVGGRVSDETVARLVRKIMIGSEGDEMRKRAGELRKAAIAALAEGGSSDSNLKAFAAAIKDQIAST